MGYVKNLKVKYLRALIHYNYMLENLKGPPKKVELVEAVTEFLEMIGRIFYIRRGWDVCGNK